MKEIIFWFDNHKIRNYWLDYAIKFLKDKKIYNIKYNNLESYIDLLDFGIYFEKYNSTEIYINSVNLRIYFKVYENEKSTMGFGNINQYWVEDLFDNNFEEFFLTFIKENLNGEKRN